MKIRVFCSYSHKDTDSSSGKLELIERLQAIAGEKLIALSYDRNIPAGEKWASWIQSYLESADILIIAVSGKYFASDECTKEMNYALKLEKGPRIVPVVIDNELEYERCTLREIEAIRVTMPPAGMDWTRAFEELKKVFDEVVQQKLDSWGQVIPKEFNTRRKNADPTRLSLDDMAQAASLLHRLINNWSDFQPDIIVGLNEGGSVVAMALRQWFKVPVGHIRVRKDNRDRRQIGYFSLPCRPKSENGGSGFEPVNPRRVLVVDTKLKGGSTLRDVEEFLKNHYGAIEVQHAVALSYGGWDVSRWTIDRKAPRWPATFVLGLKVYVAWYTDVDPDRDNISEALRRVDDVQIVSGP